MVKYNIGLKAHLQQGISVPIFYGDLVYKFKIIVRNPNFRDQFKKIIKRFSRGFLFNCTTVGQASDSMTSLT